MKTANRFVSAGDMQALIDFIEPDAAGTSDGMGGITNTADTAALENVPAMIEPVQQMKVHEGDAIRGVADHRITIRYDDQVGALNLYSGSLLVKYGSRYFEILSAVTPGDRQTIYEMLCREVNYNNG